MNTCYKFLTFYFKTSIHIGISLWCFLEITKIYLNIKIPNVFIAVVFFGTITTYNMLKFGVAFLNKKMSCRKNYLLLLVSFSSLLGFTIAFLKLEIFIIERFLVILMVLFLYPYARKNWFLKLAFVCFCVSYITVYMPFIIGNANTLQTVFLFLQRFLIVFALLIPFEIKDMKTDSKTIMTMPLVLGIKETKIIGYLCLFLFAFISFFETKHQLITCFIALITAGFLFFSTTDRNKYFTVFWVESIPIFWYLLLVYSQQ